MVTSKIIESIEEKEEKKKLNEDIKKEVKQRMILTFLYLIEIIRIKHILI